MMIAVMMVVALTVNAQNEPGKMAIGANLNYGMHKDYKNIGFGAKFQYNITDAIRGEASGNYFLKKDYMNVWDVNLNFHYLIPVGESCKIYPLVGVTLMGVKVEVPSFTYEGITYGGGSASDTSVGVNAGAGIEYYLSESFKLNLEAKYQYTKNCDWPVISIGAAYCF